LVTTRRPPPSAITTQAGPLFVKKDLPAGASSGDHTQEQEFLADDPDDPSRRMIRQILGAVNEYERSMIALRLRGGKRAAAAQGRYTGGWVRLGQQVTDGQLVSDPDAEAAIARMREMRDAGSSLRQIVAVLEDEGYQTARGGRWQPSTVSRVLSRA
jgi:DNA invertase Pin-like site-specific DNA recombinase